MDRPGDPARPPLALLLALCLGGPLGAQPGDAPPSTGGALPSPAQGQAARAREVGRTLTNQPELVTEIRRRLRGLRFIRNQMLERAVGKRYAMGGRLALLLYDTPRELEEIALLTLSYDQLVRELLAFPVDDYLRDPGTSAALTRAIEWGLDHALGVPHPHRLGYARIVRVLSGRDSLRPGTAAPESPISVEGSLG